MSNATAQVLVKSLRVTPAMAEGGSDKLWTLQGIDGANVAVVPDGEAKQ